MLCVDSVYGVYFCVHSLLMDFFHSQLLNEIQIKFPPQKKLFTEHFSETGQAGAPLGALTLSLAITMVTAVAVPKHLLFNLGFPFESF